MRSAVADTKPTQHQQDVPVVNQEHSHMKVNNANNVQSTVSQDSMHASVICVRQDQNLTQHNQDVDCVIQDTSQQVQVFVNCVQQVSTHQV